MSPNNSFHNSLRIHLPCCYFVFLCGKGHFVLYLTRLDSYYQFCTLGLSKKCSENMWYYTILVSCMHISMYLALWAIFSIQNAFFLIFLTDSMKFWSLPWGQYSKSTTHWPCSKTHMLMTINIKLVLLSFFIDSKVPIIYSRKMTNILEQPKILTKIYQPKL